MGSKWIPSVPCLGSDTWATPLQLPMPRIPTQSMALAKFTVAGHVFLASRGISIQLNKLIAVRFSWILGA